MDLRGPREKVAFYCLILPHSNVCFVKAYSRETTEAFLDGHVSAFAFLGGRVGPGWRIGLEAMGI